MDTRNSFARLKHPFRKTNTRQKILSNIDPSLWNNLPELIKNTNNLNTFKQCKKTLSKPVNRYYYRFEYSGLLFDYHNYYYCHYYYCYPFLTNPDPSAILNRWTTRKIRRFCPFCAITGF